MRLFSFSILPCLHPETTPTPRKTKLTGGITHAPFWHTAAPGQALPHEPQLAVEREGRFEGERKREKEDNVSAKMMTVSFLFFQENLAHHFRQFHSLISLSCCFFCFDRATNRPTRKEKRHEQEKSKKNKNHGTDRYPLGG